MSTVHGRMFAQALLLLVCLWLPAAVSAEEYISREQFLAGAFGESVPEQRMFWLSATMREQAQRLVGWTPRALRIRYWIDGRRSAWILEDIGKEKPITLGVVIESARISRLDVLAFRESRGWEIRHAFFTDQFRGVGLDGGGRLSRHIDGITGATLSVRAVDRVARLALWLSSQVQ